MRHLSREWTACNQKRLIRTVRYLDVLRDSGMSLVENMVAASAPLIAE